MVDTHTSEGEVDLPPPGYRWGAGAQSVLPYLTRTLQARPATAPDPHEGHPGDRAAAPGADPRRAA